MSNTVSDAPFNLDYLNEDYKECLHNAHCNHLSYFNKRKCKRLCEDLINNPSKSDYFNNIDKQI